MWVEKTLGILVFLLSKYVLQGEEPTNITCWTMKVESETTIRALLEPLPVYKQMFQDS